jgi:hypothetical protein
MFSIWLKTTLDLSGRLLSCVLAKVCPFGEGSVWKINVEVGISRLLLG